MDLQMSRELSAFEGQPSLVKIRRGSDRSFGVVIAGFCALIGFRPLLDGHEPRWWLLAFACACLIIASLVPLWFAPLNWLWFRFGKAIGAVMGPLIMAIIFFVIITPIALIQRWRDRDSLGLHYVRDAKTYWTRRNPPGPEPDSLKNQF